ncbi:MAG: NUDIX domain-containing protein [Candidatus Fimadaptatus sp.]
MSAAGEGIYPPGALGGYRYVVMLSRMDGRMLMSRHRDRATWQNQGGHIEPGETPLEAARRELFEESGALEYEMAPLCDYQFAHGAAVVYAVRVTRLGPLPESEMAEVRLFDEMPRELTYPEAGPELYDYALRMRAFEAL